MVPKNNLLSSLTYSANGSEVDTTIVDGEILMEGRELKTIDLERILYEANAMMERLPCDQSNFKGLWYFHPFAREEIVLWMNESRG